jgi:hypothetical protein
MWDVNPFICHRLAHSHSYTLPFIDSTESDFNDFKSTETVFAEDT